MYCKPNYYDEFVCVADKCKFTCCRDWKISVDLCTKEKWKNLEVPGAKQDGDTLANHVVCGWGGEQIKLKEDGFCPFLDENKLCSIVSKYGEENISQTCHIFPREEHEFADRTEMNLTMGCPAALELLWGRDSFILQITQNKDAIHNSKKKNYIPEADVSLLYIRDRFCELIQAEGYSVETAMLMFFYIVLDLYDKEGELAEGESLGKDYLESLFREAFLEQLEQAVLEVDCDLYDKYMEQNELFLDLAENYRNKKIYSEIIEPLANTAEELEDESQRDYFMEKRQFFEKEWTSFDKQIRLLLAEELYSTFYLPGGNLYTSLLKLQWLAITYSSIKHCMFLSWLKGAGKSADLQKLITVLIRMTGYSEDDIEEYLDNCFEDIIWDWGYMALMI